MTITALQADDLVQANIYMYIMWRGLTSLLAPNPPLTLDSGVSVQHRANYKNLYKTYSFIQSFVNFMLPIKPTELYLLSIWDSFGA